MFAIVVLKGMKDYLIFESMTFKIYYKKKRIIIVISFMINHNLMVSVLIQLYSNIFKKIIKENFINQKMNSIID